MIYFLIYLALGLPVAVTFAMINNDRPILNRVLYGLVMLPAWPIFVLSLLRELWTLKRIQVSCAWCGKFTVPLKHAENREVWKAHALQCPKHPMREEIERLREGLGRFADIDLRVDCHDSKLVSDILHARSILKGEK